jgi:hypothetical protein
MPQEYRSFQHLDHQGKMFLTEKELRTSIIFEVISFPPASHLLS